MTSGLRASDDTPVAGGSTSTPHSIGPHQFHIPVMGTGFTVDTPIRVAKYGISSVISIVDDDLIERLRKFYSDNSGRSYEPIENTETDSRARRIRSYLNLVKELVDEQIETVRSAPFTPESELTRYFEMLPDSPLRSAYAKMLAETDLEIRSELQADLRRQVVPGRIDVNIMTKVDRDQYINGQKGPPEKGLAMSSLRGFATSELRSAVVLSAGLNRRLFAYMAQFDDFFPTDDGPAKKTITLKVSDYRSALIQGRLLARHGLWISEFRIESGLNCGGHAFANTGYLMGPILEEFKTNHKSLRARLWKVYRDALEKLGRKPWGEPSIVISAQGGIGTAGEHEFLLSHFDLVSVGWGTPFLLVPEATNVDAVHMKKLLAAGEDDVILSDSSPLGIPFWNLQTSASEENRKRQISDGIPGSSCPKGYLGMDFEFTQTPICKSSRNYQKRKLNQLEHSNLPSNQKDAAVADVLNKTCLCSDLTGGVLIRLGIDPDLHTAICCGPSIIDFDRVFTLKEMTDHICGRSSFMHNPNRPHMFIRELFLYVNFFQRQVDKRALGLVDISDKYFTDFKSSLIDGIEYYRGMASHLDSEERARFLTDLDEYEGQVSLLNHTPGSSESEIRIVQPEPPHPHTTRH
jgi:hypothetical protein